MAGIDPEMAPSVKTIVRGGGASAAPMASHHKTPSSPPRPHSCPSTSLPGLQLEILQHLGKLEAARVLPSSLPNAHSRISALSQELANLPRLHSYPSLHASLMTENQPLPAKSAHFLQISFRFDAIYREMPRENIFFQP